MHYLKPTCQDRACLMLSEPSPTQLLCGINLFSSAGKTTHGAQPQPLQTGAISGHRCLECRHITVLKSFLSQRDGSTLHLPIFSHLVTEIRNLSHPISHGLLTVMRQIVQGQTPIQAG